MLVLVTFLFGCNAASRAPRGDPGAGDAVAADPGSGGDPTAAPGGDIRGDTGDPQAGDPWAGDPWAGDPQAGDACGRDRDSDGVDDCADLCPDDPHKTEPGNCGCGRAESSEDLDADGVSDCLDGCPTVASLTAPGVCGCFVPETDANTNGTADCLESASFRVMVISDVHVCAENGDNVTRLQELVDKVNAGDYGDIEMLAVTGDIADYLYDDYPDTNVNCLATAADILAGLPFPSLLVPGNHEYKLSDNHSSGVMFDQEEVMERSRIWSQTTSFPSYYSVDYRGWRFIVLDDIRGRYEGNYFDTAQLDWLESQLDDQLPTTIYFHIPMQTDALLTYWCSLDDLMTEEDEPRFFALLESHASHVEAVFVGHGHAWADDTLHGDIEVREATGFGKGLVVVPGTYPHFIVSFEPTGSLTVSSGL